jgi:hypothetical protein
MKEFNEKVRALATVESEEWTIEYDLQSEEYQENKVGNITEYHCSAAGSARLDEEYINVRAELNNRPEVVISDDAKIVAQVSALFDGTDTDMSTGVFVYCELHSLGGYCLAADLLDSIEYYEGFIDGGQIKRLAGEVLNAWLQKIGALKFVV